MRRGAVEPEVRRLFLLAQASPDSEGHYRLTGHGVVIEAFTPTEAAAKLVVKLRKEGNTHAVVGSLGHNVYEGGTQDSGPNWFWQENADFGRFEGCRAMGEGSYYRSR